MGERPKLLTLFTFGPNWSWGCRQVAWPCGVDRACNLSAPVPLGRIRALPPRQVTERARCPPPRREWRAPPRADGRSLPRATTRPPSGSANDAARRSPGSRSPAGSPRRSGTCSRATGPSSRRVAQGFWPPDGSPCEFDRASEPPTNLVRPQPAIERWAQLQPTTKGVPDAHHAALDNRPHLMEKLIRFYARRGVGLWNWPCGHQPRPPESKDSRSATTRRGNGLGGARDSCGAGVSFEEGSRLER